MKRFAFFLFFFLFIGTSATRAQGTSPAQSVLQSGQWLKAAVVQSGIYKITADQLVNQGFPAGSISPEKLAVFGDRGGMLPLENAVPQTTGLQQCGIQVFDGGDGQFSGSDYLLFWAEGPHAVRSISSEFRHDYNVYTDTSYYFITLLDSPGKRLELLSAPSSPPTQTTQHTDAYTFFHKDQINIAGTGRKWFGDYFDLTNIRDYTFSTPRVHMLSEPLVVTVAMAAQASTTSTCDVLVNGNPAGNLSFNPVANGTYADLFTESSNSFSVMPSGSGSQVVELVYNNFTNGGVAWLDYIELQYRQNLIFEGAPLEIRDTRTVGTGFITEFSIAGVSSDLWIWDVTDPVNVRRLAGQRTGNTLQFVAETDSLRHFVVHGNSGYFSPVALSSVGNQNLHGLGAVDYILVTRADMLSEAQRLAQFHRARGLEVAVVDVQHIYNEYSSGRADLAAIRNFFKHQHEKFAGDPHQLKYVFLFGDASYDYKNRGDNPSCVIPIFESLKSGNVGNQSFCSDDFFAMFDATEGDMLSGGDLEIGIGRAPIVNATQARQLVDKIFRYASPESFGVWRNRISFVADDMDAVWENGFMINSEAYATYIDTIAPQFRFNKIYSDAYIEESTIAGQRYPQVQQAINESVQDGALITNYIGHGGELGWSGERVLEVSDIQSWSNPDALTTFLTVTCEFTRVDDPERISAGEYCLLNPDGGAIALFSTTRVISAGFGYLVNESFYRNFFETFNGGRVRMGDLMRVVKNDVSSTAKYSFGLFGDPALPFAIPDLQVSTTSLNQTPIASGVLDTIGALQKVRLEGVITDAFGTIQTGYNGVLSPTVFDKKKEALTLDNANLGSSLPFWTQDNIIYNGQVSVQNGSWAFEFIVPKDINYSIGSGKITYYASNEEMDAAGALSNLPVGGSAQVFTPDSVGPSMQLFMNDYAFIDGGITDNSPLFIAKLNDFSGINTVGNGIGHDLVAYLDGNRNTPYYLNGYYRSDLDSYQGGEVRYPFSNLELGWHVLVMKAWDVFNNSAEDSLRFFVTDEMELIVDELRAYPNPFTTSTRITFQHNRPNTALRAELRIINSAGAVMYSEDQAISDEGYVFDEWEWDGRDARGNELQSGTYIIYVSVLDPETGERSRTYERVVFLR